MILHHCNQKTTTFTQQNYLIYLTNDIVAVVVAKEIPRNQSISIKLYLLIGEHRMTFVIGNRHGN